MALGSSLSILFLFFFVSISYSSSSGVPRPSPWPPQFHSVLYINHSGALSMVDLWYDWTNGRNFNIIQHQLGDLLYDLEWNNGISFYYSLPPSPPRCRTITFDVGILRPDWLDGATYLGQETIDGFQCNVWEKADFIWYYEDVATRRPVHWLFYTGRSVHVMTFEVGAVLEDAKWQAPAYCFEKKDEDITKPQSIISTGSHGNLMKGKSVRGLAGYRM